MNLLVLCCGIFPWMLIAEGYEIPTARFEYLSPKGFRITIPDEPGISLFAIHCKINKSFKGTEEGDYSEDVTSPTNGVWVYENPKAAIANGDVIHYWIFVQHESLGYLQDDLKHTVVKLVATTKKPTATKPTAKTSATMPTPKVASTTAKCITSVTTVNGLPACAEKLIFEDNFETLDLQKWQKEVRIPLDTESAEFLSYQDLPENSYVKDGNLFIVPTLLSKDPAFTEERIRTGELLLTRCISPTNNEYECRRKAMLSMILPPIVSAKLNTKKSFRFQYGRVEIRAKFPKGDWLFPQLMLEPFENYYGLHDFGSGKMFVGHIRSNDQLETKDALQIDGYRLRGGVIVTNKVTLRDAFLKANVGDDHYSNDFHTYGLVWKPDSISVSVDGVQFAILKGKFREFAVANNLTQSNLWSPSNTFSPFDREFYLSLGVGAGGISDFPDASRTGATKTLKPWNNTSPKAEYNFYLNRNTWYPTWTNPAMQIDYVKVYAL